MSDGGNASKTEQLAGVKSLLDIYIGNFQNKPFPRLKGDPPNRLHLVAGVFLFNPAIQKFLVQRRARKKDWYPMHFTDSASGHVSARENLSLDHVKAEMCRELKEEMGISLGSEDMKLFTILFDPEFNEIKFIFLALTTTETFKIDDEEVESRGSGWYSSNELSELIKNKPFVPSVRDLWLALACGGNKTSFQQVFENLDEWQEYWSFFNDLKSFQQDREKKNDGKKIPLFIGRFQPFHVGHLSCLKFIRKQGHESVIIGIGSPQYKRTCRNPFSIRERLQILKIIRKTELLDFKKVYIIPIPDVHCEKLWMLNVKVLFNNEIILYSNNEWVRGLASAAGISLGEKVSFKMKEFNGTNIRKRIINDKKWHDLVPGSCASFIKKNKLDAIVKKVKCPG
ncbi:MAG: nicotinamide-nucleotide adenylyltransferase [Promethearchaeota archaeon]